MKLKNSTFYLLLVITLFLSCGDDDPIDNSNAANFEFVWDTIDQNYSYFDIKEVDWDQVRVGYESQITETLSVNEFRDILSEMIFTLEDGHTGLRSNGGFYFFQGDRGAVDNSPVNTGRYVSNHAVNNSRLVIGDITGKNVRYIGVRSLSGNADSDDNDPLYNSINTLQTYDGLIIDLRNNGGGNDAIARRFVREFVDQTRTFRRFRFRDGAERDSYTPWQDDQLVPFNSIEFTKPIVLLTNRHVVSSAEGFTLMLKSMPNVMQLGDTTAGSTGNPGIFEMPNGWELFVSRWQVTDPEGNYVEGNGIAPDEVVWISQADRDTGRDTILEAAIAKF